MIAHYLMVARSLESNQCGLETPHSVKQCRACRGLNRTNVELKPDRVAFLDGYKLSLNRTNVELKHGKPNKELRFEHTLESNQCGIETQPAAPETSPLPEA